MDIIALALAKKFTDDTASQFGAVKGANCKLVGSALDGNRTKLTFSWKNDANETKQTIVYIPNGISIKSATIDDDNHLILTLSDNTEIDAGEIKATTVLSEDLKATVEIGTVKNGKVYAEGTPIETVLRDMLIKVEPPVVTLALTPNTTVYDVVTETLPTVALKATVTKKTNPVAKVDFYADTTLINSISTGVENGGSFSYTYTPATPINATTIFKVVATDNEGNKSVETISNKITVSFVANSYYGLVEPTIGEPTESDIKALTKKLKLAKGFVYSGITCDYNKVVYAYPQSMGALTSIKDVENNVNYTSSFTRTSVTVDTIPYYCYTLTEPTGADGVEVTFA